MWTFSVSTGATGFFWRRARTHCTPLTDVTSATFSFDPSAQARPPLHLGSSLADRNHSNGYADSNHLAVGQTRF